MGHFLPLAGFYGIRIGGPIRGGFHAEEESIRAYNHENAGGCWIYLLSLSRSREAGG